MTEQQEIDRIDPSGFACELVACVLLRSAEDEETHFPNAPHRIAAYVVSLSAVVILVGLLLFLAPPT